MPIRKKKNPSKKKKVLRLGLRLDATAEPHSPDVNEKVHIFVDDQNLFYGIVNNEKNPEYRIDFGDLMRVAAQSSNTNSARPVSSAYIAGVIPDDDTFWAAAKAKGFTVHRGFLSANGRSKQDDAYLITSILTTLYEEEGPSTIILVAGDADYVPPLIKCVEKGWRVEVAFTNEYGEVSSRLGPVCHEFRSFSSVDIQRSAY